MSRTPGMLAVDVEGKSGEFKPSQIECPTANGSRAGHSGLIGEMKCCQPVLPVVAGVARIGLEPTSALRIERFCHPDYHGTSHVSGLDVTVGMHRKMRGSLRF
jgi:hypothetical protein